MDNSPTIAAQIEALAEKRIVTQAMLNAGWEAMPESDTVDHESLREVFIAMLAASGMELR